MNISSSSSGVSTEGCYFKVLKRLLLKMNPSAEASYYQIIKTRLKDMLFVFRE